MYLVRKMSVVSALALMAAQVPAGAAFSVTTLGNEMVFSVNGNPYTTGDTSIDLFLNYTDTTGTTTTSHGLTPTGANSLDIGFLGATPPACIDLYLPNDDMVIGNAVAKYMVVSAIGGVYLTNGLYSDKDASIGYDSEKSKSTLYNSSVTSWAGNQVGDGKFVPRNIGYESNGMSEALVATAGRSVYGHFEFNELSLTNLYSGTGGTNKGIYLGLHVQAKLFDKDGKLLNNPLDTYWVTVTGKSNTIKFPTEPVPNVPEASSLILLAFGGLPLLAIRRRRA